MKPDVAVDVLLAAARERDTRATLLERGLTFTATGTRDIGPERKATARRLRCEAAEIKRNATLLDALHNLVRA